MADSNDPDRLTAKQQVAAHAASTWSGSSGVFWGTAIGSLGGPLGALIGGAVGGFFGATLGDQMARGAMHGANQANRQLAEKKDDNS